MTTTINPRTAPDWEPSAADQYATGHDINGAPFTIVRYGRVVLVHSPGFADPVDAEVYASRAQAAAEYANWHLDPAASAPRPEDVIDERGCGRRIRIADVRPAPGDGWTITGRTVLAKGGEGARVVFTAYPHTFTWISRPV